MKNIDHLIDVVFESPEDKAFFASLSTEEAREFTALSNLKNDLKALRDVPECQLTTEHLRQAVLNQKPATTPKPALRLWLYAPFAAAAVLAVAFLAKPTNVPNPIVTDDGVVASNTTKADSSNGLVETTPVGKNDFERAAEAAINAVPIRKSVVASTRSTGSRIRRMNAASVPGASTSSPTLTTAERSAAFDRTPSELGLGGPDERTELAMISAEAHREPVVVILDRDNPETGAAEAREISKPADVIFGG